MKTILAAAVAISVACTRAGAEIVAGPFTNPANGHDYYLLAPNSWSGSETEAKNLGGTLAIIRNAAEQDWIFSTFGHYGGQQRHLWIGFHRKVRGGAFSWVNNAPADYTNWYTGEPNNVNNIEDCAVIRADAPLPGTWNDLDDAHPQFSVVEVSDKSPVTESQRAMVGTWYASGRADQPCYLAAAKDALFAVNGTGSGSRIVFNRQGLIFAVAWQTHGEIVGDKILWSNGTWWSRKPLGYHDTANAGPAPTGIVAGPIANPSNGHDYYLLAPNSWSESEREAENLGGTLAVIRNAAEEEWVFSTFGAFGGTNRNLWIGYRRGSPNGGFVSAAGEPLTYANWAPGQPDDSGSVENFVQIWANGTWDGKGLWNDAIDGIFCYGLVELPGKAEEKALTDREKSWIGSWYEGGRDDREMWVAGTENKLFMVANGRAARLLSTPGSDWFSTSRQRGQKLQDKVLWSNGTWWSRQPMDDEIKNARTKKS